MWWEERSYTVDGVTYTNVGWIAGMDPEDNQFDSGADYWYASDGSGTITQAQAKEMIFWSSGWTGDPRPSAYMNGVPTAAPIVDFMLSLGSAPVVAVDPFIQELPGTNVFFRDTVVEGHPDFIGPVAPNNAGRPANYQGISDVDYVKPDGTVVLQPFVVRDTIPRSGNLPAEIVAGFREVAPVLNGFAGAIETVAMTATQMYVGGGIGAGGTLAANAVSKSPVGREVLKGAIDFAVEFIVPQMPNYDERRFRPDPPSDRPRIEVPRDHRSPGAGGPSPWPRGRRF